MPIDGNYAGIRPENTGLSGLIQREPEEEEQGDTWMNSGQFTTDERRPLRNGKPKGGQKSGEHSPRLDRAPEWAATARAPAEEPHTDWRLVQERMV